MKNEKNNKTYELPTTNICWDTKTNKPCDEKDENVSKSNTSFLEVSDKDIAQVTITTANNTAWELPCRYLECDKLTKAITKTQPTIISFALDRALYPNKPIDESVVSVVAGTIMRKYFC